jgi:hypothetical protein
MESLRSVFQAFLGVLCELCGELLYFFFDQSGDFGICENLKRGLTVSWLKFRFQHPVNFFRKRHADAFTEQAAQGGHVGGADGRVKINAR